MLGGERYGWLHFGAQFFFQRTLSQRPPAQSCPSLRRLRFEPLETRQLLTTVNTLLDVNDANDGLTTLREAIQATASGGVIDFSVTGTINLSSLGQLFINKNLTIVGPGAGSLTIRAYDPTPMFKNGDGGRIFQITDGDNSSWKNVSISGLTLTGGDPGGAGGAIAVNEHLEVTDCVISGNAAVRLNVYGMRLMSYGGAISSYTGNVSINGCTISGNLAGRGGGIDHYGGDLSIHNSVITGNQAELTSNPYYFFGRGGGVAFTPLYDGTLTITQSTISNNSSEYLGGGLYSKGGPVTITATAITGNASLSGGGIYNAADCTIDNCTVSGNTATSQAGGIFARGGELTLARSTVTENSADGDFGGILRHNNPTTIHDSIIAGNSTNGAHADLGFTGTLDSLTVDYSLIGTTSGLSVAELAAINNGSGNLLDVDAMLAPLAENGGPTKTHALLPGSPAINAGDPAFTSPPAYDQRGAPHARVNGERIDIGAFESEAAVEPPELPGDYNLDESVDAADYVLWRHAFDGGGIPPMDEEDYGVWTANFGDTGGGGSAELASGGERGATGLRISDVGLRMDAGGASRIVNRRSDLASAHVDARTNLPIDDALLAWLASRGAVDDELAVWDRDSFGASLESDPAELEFDAIHSVFERLAQL